LDHLQEQEQVGVETNVDSDLESDPELEHSFKRVPRWSALVPPADMNPVDWQIKLALDVDREVCGADTHSQTKDSMDEDEEDEMDVPSKETEQASCSSAQQLAPKQRASTINTFAEREHGMYFLFAFAIVTWKISTVAPPSCVYPCCYYQF
jgi:hypothetical protein